MCPCTWCTHDRSSVAKALMHGCLMSKGVFFLVCVPNETKYSCFDFVPWSILLCNVFHHFFPRQRTLSGAAVASSRWGRIRFWLLLTEVADRGILQWFRPAFPTSITQNRVDTYMYTYLLFWEKLMDSDIRLVWFWQLRAYIWVHVILKISLIMLDVTISYITTLWCWDLGLG